MSSPSLSRELEVSPQKVVIQLEAILQSPAFASSKRCQEFLRYVTLEAIEGRADSIKERTIALEVFGKGTHFESGEDSLVRVKAREVRKRLADYYETAEGAEIRIDIPIGGYAPRIQAIEKPPLTVVPDVPEETTKAISRRKLMWLLAAPLAAVGGSSILWTHRQVKSPFQRFWSRVFDSSEIMIIFVPLLPHEDETSTRVGMGAAQAAIQAAAYFASSHYPYALRFGTDLSFSQMRLHPCLLLGGFSSMWTHIMSNGLRFNMIKGGGRDIIIDTQSGQQWSTPSPTLDIPYTDEDYGIVCRLLDSASGQITLIAAGLGTFGTQSAAEILFEPDLFSKLLTKAPHDWEKKNFQAVFHTQVIERSPGPPQILAVHFW